MRGIRVATRRSGRPGLHKNMINEVTIIAKFTTGTTQDNPAKAEASIKKLLLEGLAKHSFATEHDQSGSTGLFEVKIISVKAESL